MNQLTIEFKNVTKTYQVTKGKYGLLTEKVAELLTPFFKNYKSKNTIHALKNISFRINAGETVGIIGRNGAGKSTILKLVSKITYPNRGEVYARGKIGAFIELGAGLHPELTGRENIFLYGAILGMKKKEIETKFDEIVNFAQIKKFLDLPIKKFSSGMYSRLGFSVVAHCNPDILLVDEVLAVGDMNFQKRCLDKMRSFAREKTIIFVTHDLPAIESICTRVIYLEKGKILADGKARGVINLYKKRSKDNSELL